MRDGGYWTDLVVDDQATPPPLPDERYRAWLSRQRIFISSVMDDELTPYREAVRKYLTTFGGRSVPVMWETIAPQDKHPERAFLDGVDQSTIFVLMLGESYGVSDQTGFSPTHKESDRADHRRLPRLLFTLPSSRRDGPLQRWLNSLYSKVSGISASSPEAATDRLDAVLRQMAAQAERNWVKLGRYVFPGRVNRVASAQAGTKYDVIARVTSDRTRQGLLELVGSYSSGTMPLSWPNSSYAVTIEQVQSESEFATEEAVRITCRGSEDQGRGSTPFNVVVRGGSAVSPVDQAAMWLRRAAWGEPASASSTGIDLIDIHTRVDAAPLPEVIQETCAGGWLAEGLVRLYLIEESWRRWGARFEHLSIGPALARGVPVSGQLVIDSGMFGDREVKSVEGIVPIVS